MFLLFCTFINILIFTRSKSSVFTVFYIPSVVLENKYKIPETGFATNPAKPFNTPFPKPVTLSF